MVICPKCGTEAKASDLVSKSLSLDAAKGKAFDPEFVNAPTILAMRTPEGEAPSTPKGVRSERRSLGLRLLAVVDGTNRFVEGRRQLLASLFILLCGIGGPVVDWLRQSKHPIYTVLFGNTLLFVFWLLYLTFILSLRNDDGTWNGRLLFTRVSVAQRRFWNAAFSLRGASTPVRLSRCGTTLFGLGCLILASCSVATIVMALVDSFAAGAGWPQIPWWIGVASMAVGIVLMIWGRFGSKKGL